MKITELQIQGFGNLCGEWSFSPALNVFLASSGAGKSLMATALFYLFYNEHYALRPPAACRPYQHSNFTLTATVQNSIGESFRIWRDFQRQSVIVLDRAGENIAAENDEIGAQWFGLTAEEFFALAMITAPTPLRYSSLPEDLPQTLAAKIHPRLDSENFTLAQFTAEINSAATAAPISVVSVADRAEIIKLEEELNEQERQYELLAENFQREQHAWREILSRRSEWEQQHYHAITAALTEIAQQKNDREKLIAKSTTLRAEWEKFTAALPENFKWAISENIAATCADFFAKEKAVTIARIAENSARQKLKKLEMQNTATSNDREISRADLALAESQWQNWQALQIRENAIKIDLQSAFAPFAAAGVPVDFAEQFANCETEWSNNDRDFLWNFPAAQITNNQHLTDLDQELRRHHDYAEKLTQIVNNENRARRWQWFGVVATMLISSGVIPLLAEPLYLLAPAVGCSVWLAYIFWRRSSAENFYRETKQQMSALEMELTAKREKIVAVITEQHSRYQSLQKKIAPPEETAAQIAQKFFAIISQREHWELWRTHHERYQQMVTDREKINAWWREKILPPTAANDSPTLWRLHLDQLARVLTIREEWRQAGEQMASAEQNLAIYQNELAQVTEKLRELFTEFGIAETPDLSTQIRRYDEIRKCGEQKIAIEKSLLATARELTALPSEKILSLNEEIFSARKNELLRRNPRLAQLPAKPLCSTAEWAEFDEQFRAAEMAMQIAAQNFATAQQESIAQISTLRLQLAERENTLKQSIMQNEKNQQRRTELNAKLALARDKWKEILATRLQEKLKRYPTLFPPVDWSVTNNLKLTASRSGEPQPIENFLSRSASELLTWHWRLILAQVLAVPVFIFDEPLANTDDEIFAQAFTNFFHHDFPIHSDESHAGDKSSAQIFIFTSRPQRAEKLRQFNVRAQRL